MARVSVCFALQKDFAVQNSRWRVASQWLVHWRYQSAQRRGLGGILHHQL
jgi:hypothetical protein